jgi:uncharacterized protein (TIGR03083 family)
MTMDHLPHFRREIRDFTAAARSVATADTVPLLPSCPDWSMTNIVTHLGTVHRYVGTILANKLTEQPDLTNPTFLHLPAEADLPNWPLSRDAEAKLGPMPAGLLDWFVDGADTLADLFATTDPTTHVVTWSTEQTAAFWLRMQTIEAAVHRWDAQTGVGTPAGIDTDLAVDVIEQNFEVMVPSRRAAAQVTAGQGETFRFRATDVDRTWTIRFDGDTVRLDETAEPTQEEIAGSASDLALLLWHRTGTDTPAARAWFTFAPPR